MKRKHLLTALLIGASTLGITKAQVKDVSVTVSPLIEYQWWNKNINLENNMFYGVRAGFGFGPHFELRAIAEKSFDLKGKLKSLNWNVADNLAEKLPNHTIDITRIGGEAKVNLFSGVAFSPYILAGTGIQYFDYNPLTEGTDAREHKEQQIYASLGAGLKMNISPRVVFSLEAKQLLFNMDPTNAYLNPHTQDKNEFLKNYSALASLDIYLGGSNPVLRSSLDRRIRDSYTGGFAHGLKFVLEPGVAFMDFNESFPYKDQWFIGGSAGIDFSSLVGIRGYYYQATEEPGKLSTKFNKDFRMYGANVIARLNQPRGIVPYLQFGAGYLDARKDDKNEKESDFNKNNLFAQAGAGVEIPLSRYFALYGTANAILMSKQDVSPENIVTPSQVRTNMMYTAGLRINLGAPVKSASVLYTSALEQERKRSNAEINALRSEYEEKLAAINEQLAEALREGDDTQVATLMEQRKEVLVEKNVVTAKTESAPQPRSREMMTAREFEELVDRVVEKVLTQRKSRRSHSVSDADFALVLSALRQDQKSATPSSNDALVAELKALIEKMDRNYDTLLRSNIQPQPSTTVIMPTQPKQSTPLVAPAQPLIINSDQDSYTKKEGQRAITRDVGGDLYQTSTKTSFLRYNTLAPIAGINFGEQVTANIGLRAYLQVSDTNFDFVPEFFIALGQKTGYGLSGNVIYNISLPEESPIQPYVGFGLGLFKQYDTMRAGSNIILGTNLKVGGNSIFVDYSTRNLFQNNQLAVGYRFVF
ncbi:MAG: outer membrane beta-barrel protein [Porphyromonas sp.]|nr:outer membrane beta-barrel protein [Porphyromonas sp.]